MKTLPIQKFSNILGQWIIFKQPAIFCLACLWAMPEAHAQRLKYHYIEPPTLAMEGVEKLAIAPWETSFESNAGELKQKKWDKEWAQKEAQARQAITDREQAGSDQSNVEDNSINAFFVGKTTNTNIRVGDEVDPMESFFEDKKRARQKFEKDEREKKLKSAELEKTVTDAITNALVAECIKADRGKSPGFKFYLEGLLTNPLAIVERSEMEKVMTEQSFQAGGLVDEAGAVSLGSLLGADAIITGTLDISVVAEDSQPQRDMEIETVKDAEGNKEKVVDHYEYIYTTSQDVFLRSNLKVINVETGQIIGSIEEEASAGDSKSNTFKSKEKLDEHPDGKYPSLDELKPPSLIARNLSGKMAETFANYLTPHFVATDNKIEKVKFKELKDQAKEAQRFISTEQIHRAFPLYKAMYDADPYLAKSAYNLALLYEAYGDYKEALNYYNQAYDLAEKRSDQNQYSEGIDRAGQGIKALELLESIGVGFTSQSQSVLQGGDAEALLAERVTLTGNSKKDRYEVRAEPSASAAVVSRVPGGREYPKVGEKDGWVQLVIIGGKKAWIESSKVR